MKEVFERIEQGATRYAAHPLFTRLRDPQIDAEERLSFAPWACHFVMTFADLGAFFLPVPRPRDRFEELANGHLAEEGSHWKWYLADLGTMGLDPSMLLTDALRFVFSDRTVAIRRLSYEMCRLSAGAGSMRKLVMVSALEATFQVTLDAMMSPAVELEHRRGWKLVYFGNHHATTEASHTLEDAAVHRSLEETRLDPDTSAELLSLVDEIFGCFGAFADDLLRVALDRPRLAGERAGRA